MRNIIIINLIVSVTCFSLALSSNTQAQNVVTHNKLNYLINGEPVNGWGVQLGDPSSWSTAVSNRRSESASGKIKVEPGNRNGEGDALEIIWDGKKPGQGNFGIYGNPIDLSNLENDAALFIEIKVVVPPNKDVMIGMDCGYPCGGKVHTGKNLKQLKRNEWDVLPIPLNCLTKEGLDLKKVNGPILISTDGKLQIEITNIKLLKLTEGDKGCKAP